MVKKIELLRAQKRFFEELFNRAKRARKMAELIKQGVPKQQAARMACSNSIEANKILDALQKNREIVEHLTRQAYREVCSELRKLGSS